MVKKLNQFFSTPDDAEQRDTGEKIIIGEGDTAIMVTSWSDGPRLVNCGAVTAVGALANRHGCAGERCRGAFAGVQVCRCHDLGVKL